MSLTDRDASVLLGVVLHASIQLVESMPEPDTKAARAIVAAVRKTLDRDTVPTTAARGLLTRYLALTGQPDPGDDADLATCLKAVSSVKAPPTSYALWRSTTDAFETVTTAVNDVAAFVAKPPSKVTNQQLGDRAASGLARHIWLVKGLRLDPDSAACKAMALDHLHAMGARSVDPYPMRVRTN